MKRVLRICTYPTQEIPSMGKNSFMISGMDSVETIFLAPFYSNNTLPVKKNTRLFLRPFLITPSPSSFFHRIAHEVKRLRYILSFSASGIGLIHNYHVDIVHVHSPMYFLVALYARIIGKSCFITYHGNEHSIIYSNRLIGSLFNKVFNLTFSLSVDILKYRNIFPKYGNKFRTVNNSVEEKIFSDKGQKRSKKIIAVGRMEAQKGYEYLLRGFKEFHSKNTEYKLQIVGDGSLSSDLESQVRELNLSDFVVLSGRLNQEQLVEAYNDSEIFIMTSLWEGFPKVLLEAMSCGCKIVATRVDAIPSILTPNYKYLINSKSDKDICESLSGIINEDIVELSAFYRKRLEQYSWLDIKKDMERVYLLY